MNKLKRISSILVRLQPRSVVTAQQIRDQFDVSLCTVYRRGVIWGKIIEHSTTEEELNDYIIQHYQTHSLESLARWYLSFEDQTIILEPLAFKDIVVNLVNKIKL